MRRIGYSMVLLTLFACEADDPCDEGQRYQQGACVPDAPSGGRGGSSGRGGSGGGREDAGALPEDAGMKPVEDSGMASGQCAEDRDAILGEECMTDDDCNCAAPYCAKMPGAPMGFCTVYCTPMPDDCPDGYVCFDLSALGITGYEPFCRME
jgi:hypothetical protein